MTAADLELRLMLDAIGLPAGDDWLGRLDPAERIAYAQGFIAGHAVITRRAA